MAYCGPADLVLVGWSSNAQGQLTVAQINAACQNASDYADGFFRARYGVGSCPLLAWDSSITLAVAKIAVWYLVCVRGFNPNGQADQNFRTQYEDADLFFNKVQRQQAHPQVTPAGSSANAGAQQPQLLSASVVDVSSGRKAPNRGW
jgi:phage gp36-like protein